MVPAEREFPKVTAEVIVEKDCKKNMTRAEMTLGRGSDWMFGCK